MEAEKNASTYDDLLPPQNCILNQSNSKKCAARSDENVDKRKSITAAEFLVSTYLEQELRLTRNQCQKIPA